ncbi:acetoacetyl-CoA reductase [Halorhodospira sp. 9621]|uniref:acetoacetyl-CoA reductase n=1 Tax=Halorhodospira sp. 9621 TaxID=2899135 RepID=UPI001EE802BD|nr:acetoacetyl-CoA reductase [Halorhodospira sp. 9621]MCG5534113.1 acetoacetyl-CoA reductase [Halorhodospira sp. 9621]
MSQKTALVTGGLGGLGAAVCERLGRSGHTVVTTYTSDNGRVDKWRERLQQRGVTTPVHAVQCDVADWDSCAAMAEAVRERAGPVDILVNNAGITKDGSFKKMTRENWDAVMRTNLDSVFNVTKQFADDMADRGWGRVINVASVNGRKGQFGQCNYAATKAGMHGFTMSLARELARKGVTVNTVSPGYLATDMVMSMKEEVRQQIIETIPVQRLGEPDEVASLIEYLASEDAGFITGANLDINGGLHME